MRLPVLLLAALCALSACTAPAPPVQRGATLDALPPMRAFEDPRVTRPARSNRDIARDFLDLSFQLESGRPLPVLTRFEEPISLRVTGPAPERLEVDLARLLVRLRAEAGIRIARVPAASPASITVEVVPGGALQRSVPEAACFVVPQVSSWAEFRGPGRAEATDWTTLSTRERLAIFLPADTAPQEMRDCLHEELAQALGPLNDLYRLTDSVFNDDNFHTVLTGFDMLILRATYAPDLTSGMTGSEVAARLPRLLDRLNPGGRGRPDARRSPTDRAWEAEIARALGPRGPMRARRAAALRAVALADRAGWSDNRTAFALFALGRLSLGADAETSLDAFLRAARLYAGDPATRIHEAHVAMQLAAFALGSGLPLQAIAIVDANTDAAAGAENAALLATLLLVKVEALEAVGRPAEARGLRTEALGWARYGFGSAAEVRARAGEIAAIRPRGAEGRPS